VKAGDATLVRRLLDEHPALERRLDDPLPGFDFGGTALLAAVGRHDRELVETLLAAGADINQKSHWWAGPFGVLDADHDSAWVDYLLSRGAAMDAYSAARHGRLDALRALVAADPAAVNLRGGDGQTPLHVAASVAVAAFLLDHGAEIDARDVDHESTAAMYLVKERTEVARYLVGRGAQTDILLAAALGDLELLGRHLDADPGSIRTSVNATWFPMRGPRAFGTVYIWTLGLNKTAPEVARDFGHQEAYAELMGRAPEDLQLALAAALGDEPRLRALLARRPGLVETLSEDAQRKLVDAAQDENLAAVRRMLALGWPAGATGQHGATALHWAAWHGSLEMVREILRHDPPLDAQDADYGGTPLGWAKHASVGGWHPERGDYDGTVRALLEAGAKPDSARSAAERTTS
jgi:ankyrin repeat protein